jgi:hypothetical protein
VLAVEAEESAEIPFYQRSSASIWGSIFLFPVHGSGQDARAIVARASCSPPYMPSQAGWLSMEAWRLQTAATGRTARRDGPCLFWRSWRPQARSLFAFATPLQTKGQGGLGLEARPRTNFQRPTFNAQLSTPNFQRSTFNVNCLDSMVHNSPKFDLEDRLL